MFLMCAHQRSCVPSRMRAKASLLDDNQEQYDKCECFSDLMSVRPEKAPAKQVDARTLPRMIVGLHLHASTCNCMMFDWYCVFDFLREVRGVSNVSCFFGKVI